MGMSPAPSGIAEIDVHGMTRGQARAAIDSALKKASGAYRLRVIHGYNSGVSLRDMIRSEYKKHPKVLRIEIGLNAGMTELVLREF